jgi:peptidoglycan hydrolase CwlO-like protein
MKNTLTITELRDQLNELLEHRVMPHYDTGVYEVSVDSGSMSLTISTKIEDDVAELEKENDGLVEEVDTLKSELEDVRREADRNEAAIYKLEEIRELNEALTKQGS